MSSDDDPCDALHTGDCRECREFTPLRESTRCIATCSGTDDDASSAEVQQCRRRSLVVLGDDATTTDLRRCTQHLVLTHMALGQLLRIDPSDIENLDEVLAGIRRRLTHSSVAASDTDRQGTDRDWLERVLRSQPSSADVGWTTRYPAWVEMFPSLVTLHRRRRRRRGGPEDASASASDNEVPPPPPPQLPGPPTFSEPVVDTENVTVNDDDECERAMEMVPFWEDMTLRIEDDLVRERSQRVAERDALVARVRTLDAERRVLSERVAECARDVQRRLAEVTDASRENEERLRDDVRRAVAEAETARQRWADVNRQMQDLLVVQQQQVVQQPVVQQPVVQQPVVQQPVVQQPVVQQPVVQQPVVQQPVVQQPTPPGRFGTFLGAAEAVGRVVRNVAPVASMVSTAAGIIRGVSSVAATAAAAGTAATATAAGIEAGAQALGYGVGAGALLYGAGAAANAWRQRGRADTAAAAEATMAAADDNDNVERVDDSVPPTPSVPLPETSSSVSPSEKDDLVDVFIDDGPIDDEEPPRVIARRPTTTSSTRRRIQMGMPYMDNDDVVDDGGDDGGGDDNDNDNDYVPTAAAGDGRHSSGPINLAHVCAAPYHRTAWVRRDRLRNTDVILKDSQQPHTLVQVLRTYCPRRVWVRQPRRAERVLDRRRHQGGGRLFLVERNYS